MVHSKRRVLQITIFFGTFLLFQIEATCATSAMVRRRTRCVDYVHAALLKSLLVGGYAYAHWLGRCAARARKARFIWPC